MFYHNRYFDSYAKAWPLSANVMCICKQITRTKFSPTAQFSWWHFKTNVRLVKTSENWGQNISSREGGHRFSEYLRPSWQDSERIECPKKVLSFLQKLTLPAVLHRGVERCDRFQVLMHIRAFLVKQQTGARRVMTLPGFGRGLWRFASRSEFKRSRSPPYRVHQDLCTRCWTSTPSPTRREWSGCILNPVAGFSASDLLFPSRLLLGVTHWKLISQQRPDLSRKEAIPSPALKDNSLTCWIERYFACLSKEDCENPSQHNPSFNHELQ